ncbi:MAG: hypothetical protein OXU36_10540 [Candidatus Poribacteria bacterium]|nr:hypothetical protein [Candidatus Poribacteria bacterium]
MASYKELKKYIEGLTIFQGTHRGKGFEILPFQEKFLRGFCDTEDGAALSVGRGNGKSTLIGAIGGAYFEGPFMEPASEILIVASSHSQGRKVFEPLVSFLGGQQRLRDRGRFRFANSDNDMYIKDLMTEVSIRVCGSDSRRLHGATPILLVYDEMAQWPPHQVKPMLAALETSLGKIDNARSIWIGTRPSTVDHPFSKALDGKNPEIQYSQSHHADPNDKPFSKKAVIKANPGWHHLPALRKRIRVEGLAAKKDPELLPRFKAMRLNMGIPDHENKVGVIGPEVYKGLEMPGLHDAEVMPYIMALDLSKSFAMTSAAAVSLEKVEYKGRYGHIVNALATWPGIPGLDKRSSTDGGLADYRDMHRRKELILQEGRRTVDVGEFLKVCFERWGEPECIVGDRYRESDLLDVVEPLGFSEENENLIFRGMGWKDGGEDVRRFQKMVQGEELFFVENRLMRSAFAVCRLLQDPGGNFKIAKHTERGMRGRDDAACAVVLGVAETDRRVAAEWSSDNDAEVPVLVFDPAWNF